MRKISHSWKTKLSHGIEEPLNKKYNGEWYRYSFGESGIVKEAKEFLIVVKNKGYSDALIANFLNGKRGRTDYFNLVKIDELGGIAWDNGFDFCPNYLRELSKIQSDKSC